MPDKNIFTFPAGLPGLPGELTRFELVAAAKDSPFFFLQSMQDENTGFILINPFVIFPDYEFELPDEEAEALGIKEPKEEVAVFCIVNAGRGLKDATVNLLAPVVLNTATGTARQVVLNDRRYSVRHPLPRPVSQSGRCAPRPAGPGTETKFPPATNKTIKAVHLKKSPSSASAEENNQDGEGS